MTETTIFLALHVETAHCIQRMLEISTKEMTEVKEGGVLLS
jgi:hypothetical protein